MSIDTINLAHVGLHAVGAYESLEAEVRVQDPRHGSAQQDASTAACGQRSSVSVLKHATSAKNGQNCKNSLSVTLTMAQLKQPCPFAKHCNRG